MNDKALAIRDQASTMDAWQPATLEQAIQLADTISKSGLVPDALKGKASDTLLVMMKGRELGLSVMQSLAGIHVIKGKAELSAALMRALVVSRADICVSLEIVETSNTICRMRTLRAGHKSPVTFQFTIEDAKAAGLLTNANYQKYPADMLLARCTSRICKAVYPDLVAGLYVEGELSEGIEDQSVPAQDMERRLKPMDPAKEIQVTADEAPDERTALVKELRDLCTKRAPQVGVTPREFSQGILDGFSATKIEDVSSENLQMAVNALRESMEAHGDEVVTE
jgi:hypothetical protein